MTVPAPTTPQPTPTAQWNGQQWFDWNGQQWVPIQSVTPPPPPPMVMGAPPPGQPQQQAAPRPTGTFKDYQAQRSGGLGPYWKYNNLPNGTSYWGIVARPLIETDVVAQTDGKGAVQYQNGNVRYQLEVPFRMVPQPGFADGLGRMGFKSDSRDKLNTAMAYAGAPEHPDGGYVPEAGAFIQVTKVGERQIPGWNNAITYEVVYRRPHEQWTIERTAEIEEAHRRLAEAPAAPAGPPPQPVWDGQNWVIPAQAAPVAQPMQVPPPAPAQTVPAPTASVPPPTSPATQPGPSPAVAGATADQLARVQAAVAHVATADANGQPPAQVPPGQQALTVPAPAGVTQPAPVTSAAPAAPATGNGETPQITLAQWAMMSPEQRGALENVTRQRCPDTGPDGQALAVVGSQIR